MPSSWRVFECSETFRIHYTSFQRAISVTFCSNNNIWAIKSCGNVGVSSMTAPEAYGLSPVTRRKQSLGFRAASWSSKKFQCMQ
ncbi:hypothetical protein Plhal304r1_c007g0029731 [Plasmopara halstedii]